MGKRVINKRNIMIIMLICVVMAIGGISAYFTAADDVTNTWTVGKIEIDLQEPEYDKVPEEREDITPNKEMTKDPQIENTGVNDAYVFARVTVPKAKVKIANQDGTAQPAEVRELFSYTLNDGWYQVSKTEGTTDNTYVYAYASSTACTRLTAAAKTPSLFKADKITFINIVEGQGLEEETLEMPVEAFGIQTADLNDKTDGVDKTSPSAVWNILINQVDSNH